MEISGTSNEVVQGLWIGGALSNLEKLSIASFLAHGHAYHLYTYDHVEGIPRGTVIKSACEVLPRSRIFQHKGSYAMFADLFRYELLLRLGGWWVDADIVALRRFDFDSDFVFASERAQNGRDTVTNCVIKAPAGSPLFADAIEFCRTANFEKLPWAMSGPGIMHQLILRSWLCRFVQEAETFCPLDHWNFFQAALPTRVAGEKSFAVHLWNELWRGYDMDKNGRFAPDSVYETLKSKFREFM